MNKVIVIGCIFIFAMFFFTQQLSADTGLEMGRGYDYQFHFVNAQGGTEWRHYAPHSFTEYPPLFKWISSPFSFHENAFYLFTLLLLCILLPIIIYHYSRDLWLIFSYFVVANFVWVVDIIGAYTQLIATMFLFAFVYSKNEWVRLGLIVVSLLLHRWAWALLLSYWVVETVVEEVVKWRSLKC